MYTKHEWTTWEHIWSNWKRLHRRDFLAIYLLLRQVPRPNGIEMKMEFALRLCRVSHVFGRGTKCGQYIQAISTRYISFSFFFLVADGFAWITVSSLVWQTENLELLLLQQLDIYIKSYTFRSFIYGMPVSVYFLINYFAVLLLNQKETKKKKGREVKEKNGEKTTTNEQLSEFEYIFYRL